MDSKIRTPLRRDGEFVAAEVAKCASHAERKLPGKAELTGRGQDNVRPKMGPFKIRELEGRLQRFPHRNDAIS